MKVDQWDRRGSPEVATDKYHQLIFDKETGNSIVTGGSLQHMMLEQPVSLDTQESHFDRALVPFTKINSKRIKDLNVKCKIMKFLTA